MISVNGFSLSNYHEMEGLEGMVMKGDLKYGKKVIAHFFDAGNGGQMWIYPYDPQQYEEGLNEIKKIFDRIGYICGKNEDPLSTFIYLIADVADSVSTTKRWAKKERIEKPAIGIAIIYPKGAPKMQSLDVQGASSLSFAGSKGLYRTDNFECERVITTVSNLRPRSIQINL